MMETVSGPPNVAEIDLGALGANYRAIKSAGDGAELMAVVKADAYGHGAVEVTRALRDEGCVHFGVARVCEARELRAAGVRERIYLLGGFLAGEADEIVGLDLTPFVYDVALIAPLERAVESRARANFRIHLKIDSGATRLGILPGEVDQAITEFGRAPSLLVEGLCTLLVNARAAGIEPRIAHVANSAASVLRPDARYSLLRPGLAIYGLPPVPAVRELVELRPVMTFKSRVVQVKRVPAGVGVSYGHTFVTPRPSVIGVLAVGYADGYRRGLQHGGEVMIRGRRAPVVGAVCMDLTMVDLTDVPGAATGDEVILWGGAGEAMISVNDIARLAQTISYEMLCTVGKRVPRVYRRAA